MGPAMYVYLICRHVFTTLTLEHVVATLTKVTVATLTEVLVTITLVAFAIPFVALLTPS
jgi:hypothetical protein